MKNIKHLLTVLVLVALASMMLCTGALAADPAISADVVAINDSQVKLTVTLPAGEISSATVLMNYDTSKLINPVATPNSSYAATATASAKDGQIKGGFFAAMGVAAEKQSDWILSVTFDIVDGKTVSKDDFTVGSTMKVQVGGVDYKNVNLTFSCSHYADAGVVTEPTCSDGGYTTYTCTVCGHSYKGNEVAAKGHNIKRYPAAESTCTTKGHAAYEECLNDCGHNTYAGELPLAEHSYGAVTFTWKDDNSAVYSAECGKCDHSEAGNAEVESNYTAATKCDEYGYTVYTASVDTVDARGTVITGSDTETVKDAAPLGHDLKDVAAKAATCTEDGYTAHKDCSRCDYTEGKTVEGATGHDYDVSFNWAVDGAFATYAAVCQNDNEHKLNGNATVKQTAGDDGDCKTLGSYTYTASVTIDGEVYTDTKTVDGVYGKHDAEKVPAVTATCVKDGNVEHWHCDVCEKNFKEEACINELAVVSTSDPDNHEDWEMVDGKEQTCTQEGRKDYYFCNDCGKIFENRDDDGNLTDEVANLEDLVIPADDDHHVLAWYESFEGTCQVPGHDAHIYCEECLEWWNIPEGVTYDDLQSEDFSISMLGAAAGEKVNEPDIPKVLVDEDVNTDNHDCYESDADNHWTTCNGENGEPEAHDFMDPVSTGGKKISTCKVCNYKKIENIPAGTTSPKTGDEANIALWTVLVLGCGAGAVLLSRKKEN